MTEPAQFLKAWLPTWLRLMRDRQIEDSKMNMYVGPTVAAQIDIMKFEIPKLGRDAVIFDLDSCLSDDRWRLGNIVKSEKGHRLIEACYDYDEYHKGIPLDAPLQPALDMINALKTGHWILFVTARPMIQWHPTVQWLLERCGLEYRNDYFLFMRPNGDLRGSVELKRDIATRLKKATEDGGKSILQAYDDREDVVQMYIELGIPAAVLDVDGVRAVAPIQMHAEVEESLPDLPNCRCFMNPIAETPKMNAAAILAQAAATFEERNARYKNNFEKVGAVMKALFPSGVGLLEPEDHEMYHLFELMIVKMTRFVNSGMKHKDSIHDLMVYAAMVESLTDNHHIDCEDFDD